MFDLLVNKITLIKDIDHVHIQKLTENVSVYSYIIHVNKTVHISLRLITPNRTNYIILATHVVTVCLRIVYQNLMQLLRIFHVNINGKIYFSVLYCTTIILKILKSAI